MDYCANCGAELKPAARFCSSCGAAQTEVEAVQAEMFEPEAVERAAPAAVDVGKPITPHKIENHLIKSVIATVCCCVPFGIVGIVYAAKVDAFLREGDRAAAEEASKKAGMWGNLAIGVGLVVNLLATVLTFYQLREGVL